MAFLFTFSTQAFAVDFTVNLTTDQHDANLADGVCDIGAGTGQCSLRAAVEQANNLVSDDRVFFNLPANSIITLTSANGGDISIESSLGTFFGALEINGTGANNLTIDGGAGTNRIFSFRNASSAIISGVTLTGGNGTSAITSIFQRSKPTVQDSGNGGAIFSYLSILTLDSVHVTGNSASNEGGGLYFTWGTLRIINSTFSANTANSGGGVRLFETAAGDTFGTVVNSTLSGNMATNKGGGLYNDRVPSYVLNVTITNNTALEGGGSYQESDGSRYGNTIISGNTATGGSAPEIYNVISSFRSMGGNLVGDSQGDSTNTGFPVLTYQPTDIRDVNPQLDILRYNGGTTPTHRLFANSPAIDKGLNAFAVLPSYDRYYDLSLLNGTPLVFDQRGAGFPRIIDGNNDGTPTVDIGAFEYQGRPTAASVSVAGRVTTANRRGISRALVRMTDSTGIVRTTYTNTFGYYSFDGVQVGQTVIFDVRSKRYNFTQPTQVVSLDGNSSRVNFTAY